MTDDNRGNGDGRTFGKAAKLGDCAEEPASAHELLGRDSSSELCWLRREHGRTHSPESEVARLGASWGEVG